MPISPQIKITDDTPSGETHIVGVFPEDSETKHDSFVDLDSFSSSGNSSSSSSSSCSNSSSDEEDDSSATSSGSACSSSSDSREDEDGWDTGAESTDDDNDDDDEDNDTAGAIATRDALGPSPFRQEAPTMEQIHSSLVDPQFLSHNQQRLPVLSEQEQYMEDEYDARQRQFNAMEEQERMNSYQEPYIEQRLLNDHYYQQQQEEQNEQYSPLHREPFNKMDEEDPLFSPWQSPTKSHDETMPDTFEDEFDLDKEYYSKNGFLVLLPRIIACTCIAIAVLMVVWILLIRGKDAAIPAPVPVPLTQNENQTSSPVTPVPVPETLAPSTTAPTFAPTFAPSDLPTGIPTVAPTIDPWIEEIENLDTDESVSLESFQYQVDISMDGSTMVVVSLDQASSTENVQVYSLKENAWQDVAFTKATEKARRRHLQQVSTSSVWQQSIVVLSNSGKELLKSNSNGTNVYQLDASNVWMPKGQTLMNRGTMSGDGKTLIAGSSFYTWDGAVWVENTARVLPFDNFERVSLSSDGSVVAAIVANISQISLHVLRWKESKGQWNENILSNKSIHCALSSDGTTVVDVGNETTTIFRFAEKEWAVYGSPIQESYNEVAVSADGLTFAAAAVSGWAQIYDYDIASMDWIETAPGKIVAPSGSGISGIWLSGNGLRLGLGVVPRFEAGMSFVMTLSRKATGPTAAPSVAPTIMHIKECNGLATLCETKVNEVMFAAATKSENASVSDYQAALELGVRGFEWKISSDLNFTTEVGAVLFSYVYDNPNEVLILHLQIGQSDEPTVESLLTAIGYNKTLEMFGEYFYKHSPSVTSWPTLSEMIENNQRVIVFVNNSSSEVFNNWNEYVSEIHDPTVCDNQTKSEFDAIYFSPKASTNETTPLLFDLDLFVNECKTPNMVFFDHFGSNDAVSVVEAVQKYNGLLLSSTSGPASVSPSLAPSLSPHPTGSVAPSDVPTLFPSSEPSISSSPTFGPTLTLQPSITAGPTSSFVPTTSLYPTGTSFPTGTAFPTTSFDSSATTAPTEKTATTIAPTASQTTLGTNIFNRPTA